MVSKPLARVLAERRAAFNRRVVEARRQQPRLDMAAFGTFVATGVDAVCVAVDAIDKQASSEAVEAAFDIGLELVGQGLAGPVARLPWVDRAWQRLPQAMARLIAQAPADALGTLTNAVVRLGGVPGVRVEEWIDRMSALAQRCDSLDQFRSLGAVCAWRVGMAHLRQVALDSGERLPPELASAAIGAPSMQWAAARERLQGERWWNPATNAIDAQGQTVGGFCGLGGAFPAPADVRVGADGFLVESAGRHFLVIADAFGATLLPATADEFARASHADARAVTFTPQGPRIGNTLINFSVPTGQMKAVASADSIALFSPWSHYIRIVPIRH